MHKQVIRYLGGLTVSQGSAAGSPLEVLPWQRRFLKGALADGVGEAALSMARGGGKSTLMAGLGMAFIDAPEVAQPASEVTIIAASEKQGRVIFGHMLRFADALGKPHLRCYRGRMELRIENRRNDAQVQVMTASPRALHGAAPSLILADEVAQWAPTKAAAILAALRTGLGKIPGSRLIALGTRSAGVADPWQEFISAANFAQVHAAKESDPDFQLRTWQKANPSLRRPDLFASLLEAYRREAHSARESEAVLQSFLALRLNRGVADTVESWLLPSERWADIEDPSAPNITKPYILGVDLGGTMAMTAAAAFVPKSGALDGLAVLPSIPDLRAREIHDAVPGLYRRLLADGSLSLAEGHTVPVEGLLEKAFRRWGAPALIVADRFRKGELLDALESTGLRNCRLISRGMGFRDGAEDVRRFRDAVLRGKVSVRPSLLFRQALQEARTVSDVKGNEKLAVRGQGGRRRRGRDDVAAAAVLAVAEGIRQRRVFRRPRIRTYRV
ncbi:MAG: terminase large subunit [Gemmatimonadota bacterium]|nr:terminase large subunit [Gemmatimonadota bacterium]MDE2814310.1 terminase large subunit [Gemmatimonadota bacterium]